MTAPMDDLDAPATKRDLRDALKEHPTRTEMHQSFDAFLVVLTDHLDKRFEQSRIDMIATVDRMGETLREEMRELSKTDLRAIRDDLKHYDDKYSDLPARVTRLESAVFKPTPLKRRRTR